MKRNGGVLLCRCRREKETAELRILREKEAFEKSFKVST